MGMFFDYETGEDLQIELRRVSEHDYELVRSFGYNDEHHQHPFVVPADLKTFRTDLASIPWFFAWLVPGQGSHLPAILLHDGLVVGPGESKSHIGDDISRLEADRILRDAMRALGTPTLRRWLIWAAVVLATAWSDLLPRWRWRTLIIATFGLIGLLGVVATLDLLDAGDHVTWLEWVPELPWMADNPWWVELVLGAAGAVIIPLAISIFWGSLWPVAAIGGIALAVLLHTTIAVLVTYGAYLFVERYVPD